MKRISEITADDIAQYLRLDFDDNYVPICLASAKAYISSYTGLTQNEMDNFTDLIPVVYVLAATYYEERLYETTGKTSFSVNKMILNTLDMHRVNHL